MSNYRLEAKIRNARFLRALESIGETPTGFARKNRLNVSRMCELAAMKAKPINAKGDWWPEVMALCEAANVMPCDLFTARQMEGFEVTRSSQDVGEGQIAHQAASMEALLLAARSPERRAVETDIANRLFASLQETHPRHARAVALDQEGITLDEVGAELSVSRERVRQIISMGYRIMRGRAMKKMGVGSYAMMEAAQ